MRHKSPIDTKYLKIPLQPGSEGDTEDEVNQRKAVLA